MNCPQENQTLLFNQQQQVMANFHPNQQVMTNFHPNQQLTTNIQQTPTAPPITYTTQPNIPPPQYDQVVLKEAM